MLLKFILPAFILVLCAAFFNAGSAQSKMGKHPVKHRYVKKKPLSSIEQGKKLIAIDNCLSCHKPDIKLIGPAFKDIAAKYSPTETNFDQLSKKIITGGSGNWGELAMSPHPDLKPADARKMVTYILSIK